MAGDAIASDFKMFAHEYSGLVEESEEIDFRTSGDVDHIDVGSARTDSGLHSPASEEGPSGRWSNDIRAINGQHRARQSVWRSSITSDGTLFSTCQDLRHSDETLHDLPAHVREVKPPLIQRVGRGAFATAERALVFLGYMQVLTGMVTYTGVCRNSWVNGCLAHLISARVSLSMLGLFSN